MDNQSLFPSIVVICTCLFAGPSQAALFDRGGGLIYDDFLDVTWLQDAGSYKTPNPVTGELVSSTLNWSEANTWASNFEYFDTVRNVTWDNWRLPRTFVQNDVRVNYEYDTTGMNSELGYMYYINLEYDPLYTHDRFAPAPSSDAYNPFINEDFRGTWSETASDTFTNMAYYLHMHFGSLELTSMQDEQRVWVLMDGDVAPVPLPPAILFMLSGLALFRFFNRNNRTALS